MPAPRSRPHAFTLIELLVVIAVIAILAALIFPAVNSVMKNSHQSTSASNLRQWFAAYNAAVTDQNGDIPLPSSASMDASLEEAWYNSMPQHAGSRPLAQLVGTPQMPVPKAKSIWINPAVPGGQGRNAFIFCYGFNDYLVDPVGGDKVPLKAARLTRPTLTVLMAEKADATPGVNVNNIRSYFGKGSDAVKDPDGAANILFCDGHVALVKRSDFSNVDTLNPKLIERGGLALSWMPIAEE